jgi:hypothetical protein
MDCRDLCYLVLKLVLSVNSHMCTADVYIVTRGKLYIYCVHMTHESFCHRVE